MARAGGHPRGFDYLRIGLAVCLVAFHSYVVTVSVAGDHQLWRSALRPVLRLLLPMFFALSGFLVAGSLVRCKSLLEFGLMRALRIVPALFVEIALSALVLGPLLTAWPLARYFRARSFYAYFLNVVGDVHFSLPGVFLHNPRPGLVNGALWTIPWEAGCYACLALLALTGLVRRRAVFAAIVAAALIGLAVRTALVDDIHYVPPGPFLVVSFLAGVGLFLYRDRTPRAPGLFLASLVATVVFLSLDRLVYLAVLPLCYATVFVGTMQVRKTILLSGDYSYGLYLFAYPIQQAFVQVFPGARQGPMVFAVCLPLGLAWAAFSWHVIEHPILRRRQSLATRLGWRAPAVM